MAGDDEKKEGEFSLEDILAEFATDRQGETGEKEPKREENRDKEAEKVSENDLPQDESAPSRQVPQTPKKVRQTPRKSVPEAPKSVPKGGGKERSAKKAGKEGKNWAEDTIPFPIPPSSPDWAEDTIPFPVPPPPPEEDAAQDKPGVLTQFPGPRARAGLEEDVEALEEEGEDGLDGPSGGEAGEDGEGLSDETKVLEFPRQGKEERPSLVAEGLERLRRKADDFAGHMFEEEGVENDEQVRKAEKLIPGVDEETAAAPPRRAKRLERRPPPDLPPGELAKRYGRGLKALRARRNGVFALFLLAFYLTLAEHWPLPIPAPLAVSGAWRCYALALLQGLAMVLGADLLLRGLIRPFQGRAGMDTMVAVSNLAALADALTLPALTGAESGALERQPYAMVAMLALFFVMLGEQQRRRGARLACKTAASASEPYLVTRDVGKWNGRDTYAKWSAPVTGFGSQMQGSDGAERVFRLFVPVLMAACFLFSIISSLGRARPEDLLWCLAATFTAGASFSATLCFGRPWQRLCVRLFRSGAALAGWEGATNTTGASNLLLYDADLFPPGTVKLNGVKIFGDFSNEKVVSCAATVVRDTGSGLERVFHDLLRAQGGVYRRGEELLTHEGGGASEVIRGELVLVGSASFMELMDVALPAGLNVKNAVFCAIDGELAGIFALSYHLAPAVPPALDTLIRNHITPVLCTRDFNIIPSMLRSRFKLPVDKMEFPAIERRRELSDPQQAHDPTLAAVLCREGIAPYAEAVVGGKRLRTAVRLSAVLCCLGAGVGAVLAFYLTFVGAYGSLTPGNLLMFLLMWLVPTPLISNWVDRY